MSATDRITAARRRPPPIADEGLDELPAPPRRAAPVDVSRRSVHSDDRVTKPPQDDILAETTRHFKKSQKTFKAEFISPDGEARLFTAWHTADGRLSVTIKRVADGQNLFSLTSNTPDGELDEHDVVYLSAVLSR